MGKYFIEQGELEAETKKQLKQYFKDNGIWYKMIKPSAMGTSVGMSDFLCLHKGLFIAVEAKRNLPNVSPTPKQQEYIDEVNKRGGLGLWVKDEEGIIELDRLLKERGVI